MTYEPGSPEQLFEQRVDRLVAELDEICGLANDPEQRDLVATQAIGIGQVQFRASLILSFLNEAPVSFRPCEAPKRIATRTSP